MPGDVFGAGLDGICPGLPEAWDEAKRIKACEDVCAANVTCLGFTYYQEPTKFYHHNASACCFRTGSTSYKPPDANSTARCYEKQAKGRECEGAPLGVMVTSPSLSYAFPAANPAIRLMEFSDEDLSLKDMHTYAADLHAANSLGKVDWRLEYSFAEAFGLNKDKESGGISPAALATLARKMSFNGSEEWDRYRGGTNGTLYCRGWQGDVGTAASHCEQGCQGDCKRKWIAVLNGTRTSS